MSKTRFTVFAVVTLMLVVAAAVSSYQRAPETVVEKSLLYPDLLEQINSVTEISIRDKEHQTVLSRQGDLWVMKNRDGYPAIFNNVKDSLLAIARLQVLEGKTHNPELYTRLDVEGTEAEPGKSTLLTLRDDRGKAMASLVIGKERQTSSANQQASLYVRNSDEERALLVEGSLTTLHAAPSRWMNSMLFDIKAPNISDIVIEHADGSQLHLSRAEAGSGALSLHDIEEGYRLKSKAALNSLMTALEELRFQGVMADSSFRPEGEKTITSLKTYEGVTITATTYQQGEKYFSQFSFSFAPPETAVEGGDVAQMRAYVEQLSARTGNWTYEIPPFKAELLTRHSSDLLRKDATADPG